MMDEAEALLEALFAAVELDEDVLHRITLAVIEDLRERGELDQGQASRR